MIQNLDKIPAKMVQNRAVEGVGAPFGSLSLWAAFGCLLTPKYLLASTWTLLGQFLGGSGAVLGATWAALAPSWAPSWAVLGYLRT